MLRVEQLSLQLEDLRRGKLNGIQTTLGGQVTGAAALELRKLYQELQVLQKEVQHLENTSLCSTMSSLFLTTVMVVSIVLKNLCVSLLLNLSSTDPEQVEPGAEQQAAATEGASQQTQHGGDADGQAHQRVAGTPLQEKS